MNSRSPSPAKAGEYGRRLLPELVEEILCKLPVKSLKRLRSVSKSWESLITDNRFMRKHHLSQSDKLFEKFRISSTPMDIQDDQQYLNGLPLACLDTMPTDWDGNLFGKVSKYSAILLATCDGLLCVLEHRCWSVDCVYIWNPCLNKNRYILSLGKKTYCKFGLGYDSKTDDYKLLKLSRRRRRVGAIETEIYSMKTRSWKKVDDFPQQSFPNYDNALFADGAVHWLVFRRDSLSYVFISFDLSENKYIETPLPDQDQPMPRDDPTPVRPCVLRGMICVHITSNFPSCDHGHVLWATTNYKNPRSWSRLLALTSHQVDPHGLCRYADSFRPLYLYENGDVLMGAAYSKCEIELLTCRDSRVLSRQIRKIDSYYLPAIQKCGFVLVDSLIVHVDSLISPGPCRRMLDN